MKTFLLCLKSDLKFFIRNTLKKYLGLELKKVTKAETKISSKVSVRKIMKSR